MTKVEKLVDGKNIAFITEDVHASYGWTFNIKPSAQTGSEISEEILYNIKKLYGIIEGFVIPTRINYWLGDVEDGESDTELTNKYQPKKQKVEDSAGVKYIDFVESVTHHTPPRGRSHYIPRFEMESSRVKIFLKSGDTDITETDTECYRSQSRDRIVGDPPCSPIKITLRHQDNSYSEAAKSHQIDTVYTLQINSSSDIWLGDSPVERVNRNRFGEVLERIYHDFDVIETDFYADGSRYRDIDVARLVFEEKRDEAELIKEAKRWIENQQNK